MSDLTRFLSYVDKQEGECWMWKGGKDIKGYGVFFYKGKTNLAHRVSLRLHSNNKHFIFDKEKQVRHLCGKTSCVNPDHLKEGTRAENNADKITHGTSLKGERCHFSKLSWEISEEIRSSNETRKDLATIYDVSVSCISSIINNKTWV
jgi:hypothetical protein